MVREVKNLTGIKLTESDTDGIWLHFESKGLKAGIALSELLYVHGNLIDKTIEAWAREQLDKQKVVHRRFYLKQKYSTLPAPPSNEFLKEGNEKRTAKPGTRPSPLVEGGY